MGFIHRFLLILEDSHGVERVNSELLGMRM